MNRFIQVVIASSAYRIGRCTSSTGDLFYCPAFLKKNQENTSERGSQ